MEIKFDNVTYKENINTPLEMTFLKNFSTLIKDNSITAFLGDSESGISKIGDLINATSRPLIGKVYIGKFVNDKGVIKKVNRLRTNIGLVTMDPSLMLFNKTVSDELLFGVKYFKYKINKKMIRQSEALTLVGLNDSYLNKKISELSLREKKKVSLASILIFNPNVIILDEPTYFISYNDIEELKKLIVLLKEKYNKTIIILTKDTDFVYEIADRVNIVYHGSLITSGVKDLLSDSVLLDSYNLKMPSILRFINEASKKDIKLKLTNNIEELVREVEDNVKQ